MSEVCPHCGRTVNAPLDTHKRVCPKRPNRNHDLTWGWKEWHR